MKDVRLTARRRAFPSQGRVRINIAHLPVLEINDGDRVELINEATQKTVLTTAIADNQVREGQIRISDEDLMSLGLDDEAEVLVRGAPPLHEKIRMAASDANQSFSKSIEDLDRAAKKTATELGSEAAKAAGSVSKAAEKTVKDVKKAVKKATGPKDSL